MHECLVLPLGVSRLAPLSADFLCQSNRERSCEPGGYPAVSVPPEALLPPVVLWKSVLQGRVLSVEAVCQL